MKVAREHQLRLIELQDFDTAVSQLNHKEKTLPEILRRDQLKAALPIAENALVSAKTVASDIQKLVKRADEDVEQVRQRISKDSALLDSGTLSPKDLVNMQHELETLKRRQNVLEDEELEIMTKAEEAEGVAIAAQSEFEQAKAELESATAAADILIAEIKAERDQNFTHIEQLRKVIDLDLIKLYDKIKSDQGGIGAAKLVDKTCDGCRLELSSTDLSAIKASDVEEVIRCDNCRRILVR
ncbi:MAG: hypothetical protein GM45_0210 [actinobacterium acAMD-5]|jgi:hypothetical protein|nr:MAG: hypothetical protein GM45_0210 [actinobacterium acAMD-5]